MGEIRFKPIAWTTKTGKPSLLHLVHDGKLLCSAAPVPEKTESAEGRNSCMRCVRRGRAIQGRNIGTGEIISAAAQSTEG